MASSVRGCRRRERPAVPGRLTVRRVRESIFTEITASDSTGKTLAHGIQTHRIA